MIYALLERQVAEAIGRRLANCCDQALHKCNECARLPRVWAFSASISRDGTAMGREIASDLSAGKYPTRLRNVRSSKIERLCAGSVRQAHAGHFTCEATFYVLFCLTHGIDHSATTG
eukprot:4116655-Pleurochrysis_carterae.AAC.1